MNDLLVLITLFFSLLFSGVSVGATADPDTQQYQGKIYRVATRPNDIGNHIIFSELAKHFNFKVKFSYYDQFSQVMDAVKTRKADFTGNITYSNERSHELDISRPTNIEYTYLYTLPEFLDTRSLKEVNSIGVAHDLIFIPLIKNLYPNIKIIEFTSYEQAKQLIKTKQVDGIVDNFSKLSYFLNDGFEAQILNDKLPIQPVGIATAKNSHKELVGRMVDYLHTPEMQKKIRQQMELYQHQIRQRILRNRVAKLGIDRLVPLNIKLENVIQLSEYDKNGQVNGIAGDLLRQSCEVLGLVCHITSKADEPWTSMYSDLLNNKIDVLGPVTNSASRMDKMYFSNAYFSPEAIVVKRAGYKNNVYKSISEMIVERISVITGDYYDQLLTNMLPGKTLYRMDTRGQQIKALLEGKVDYVVFNKQNYNKMMIDDVADFSTEEDTTIGVFHTSSIAFAFPKTEKGHKLAMLFNGAQNLINVSDIVAKYDVQPNWRSTIQQEKHFNYIIWSVFASTTIFMLLIVWLVYRQAIIDNLTKLKNRRALYQKFSRGIPANKVVIYIDVNKFKVINDTYGHQAGDKVLKHLGTLISHSWSGQAFRLGGDEFVLIGKYDDDELSSILRPLQQFSVDIPTGEQGTSITVRTSIGISSQRDQQLDIDQVLHIADVEMYRKKQANGNKKTDQALYAGELQEI